METQQVLDVLKPKAASLGFDEKELMTASETIAGQHPEEATTEEVTAAVEATLPFLKLSQSAANRSYERLKTQFEKDHPKKTPEEIEAERKAAEEAERKRKEDEEKRKKQELDEPEWAKTKFAAYEKRIKDIEDENKALKAEKTNSDFRKKAVDALKEAKIDESYYALSLKGKAFEKQEDVDAFVQEVKDGWEAMSKKLKFNDLSRVKPPLGGSAAGDQPSKAVKDRIERRKASGAVASPIRGLDQKK